MKTNLRVWPDKENTRRKTKQQSTLKGKRENKRIGGLLLLDLLPHHLPIRRVWNQNFKLWKGNGFEGGAREVNQ